MYLCAFEEKEEDEKLLSLLSSKKKEKKRSEQEISKIINGRATVIVYIYTVTVARIFLHNFRRTNVEHFLGKMCKNCVLHDFRRTDVNALTNTHSLAFAHT